MDFTKVIGFVAAFCITVSEEMLGHRFGWRSLAQDVFYVSSGCGAVGDLWFFEKRCRHHHRERRELGPAHGHPILRAPGAPCARLKQARGEGQWNPEAH
jgi:hypothetical protein